MVHSDDDAHVAGCPDCQARATLISLDVNLERAWAGVAAEVWARPVGPLERLAGNLLGSPALARALVTTPSLVLSWILATAAVLAVGSVFTRSTGTPWVALLAPALAGAGIAYAYGPGVDPAFELSRSLPVSDRAILLVRSLAVFGVNALLGLVASLFSGAAYSLTFSWLVPMTTVCALALAAATLARSANVGVAAALTGWALAVLASTAATQTPATAVVDAALLPPYLMGTVLFTGLAWYASSAKWEDKLRWQ